MQANCKRIYYVFRRSDFTPGSLIGKQCYFTNPLSLGMLKSHDTRFISRSESGTISKGPNGRQQEFFTDSTPISVTIASIAGNLRRQSKSMHSACPSS